MNPNYMNFFDPAASGGMPMGLNASNYRGMTMPHGSGSFIDMINGPPMMNPGTQPHIPRYNPNMYSMYVPSPFGMENSAARLQQFARQQLAPRPSNFGLSGQNMEEQLVMYNSMQQMARMRMKQSGMPDYGSQPRYGPPMPPWTRMPSSMPHLQQQNLQRNPLEMMPGMNSDAIRMTNLHPHSAQPPPGPSYRKMPILEEAPPSLRGPSTPLGQQQQQNLNSQQYINRMFSNLPANTVASPSYSQQQQQQSNPSLNLNSSDALNLPNMNFPSPQRAQSQPQGSFPSHFLSNFTNELNSIPSSVPQSPKLTHFGPSPASSVTSFQQLTPSTTANQQTTAVTQTPLFGPQTPNPLIAGSPASMNYLPMSPLTSTKLKQRPSNSGQSKFQSYFLEMQNIQQQLNRLKQGQQTPQVLTQIQMLNQEYQMIFKQYEAAKQQPDNMLNQQLPPPPQQQPIMQPILPQETIEEGQSRALLEDSLIEDGLTIPDLGDFDSKDNLLTDDTKTDSLFPASFFGGSELFPGSSLFGGDSLGDIKLEDEKKPLDDMLSVTDKKDIKQPENNMFTPNLKPSMDGNAFFQAMQNQHTLPGSLQLHNEQTFQSLHPVMSQKQPEQQQQQQQFLPFPFHHPQFAPQQHPHMQQHMMSISDLLSKTTVTTTLTMSSASMSSSHTGNIPPMLYDSMKQPKGGKGRGKTGKGAGKGKAGRPPGSLNKRKRKDKDMKKNIDLDPSDFDNLAPDDMLLNDVDESFLDPAMRRSLRERTKKKNYKDDFDYNLSEDEDKNKDEQEGEEIDATKSVEPAITGGVNQLVAYHPNLEVEGEIAVIEKILAMRTRHIDEPDGDPNTMVEEFFVKYKGYSYLHCEWGTVEKLAKKDKRVYAKAKRYQQKRDTSLAFLNELDDEPFNPDYLEIDRVLDVQTTVDPVTNETLYHYLVKWRALPYEESTWELQMNIDDSLIQQFHDLKKPPPEDQRKFIPQPNEMEWKKFDKSLSYKNNNKLHEYQLEGLNWLTFCWYKRINCILADEMGLGKTIQSISLLCAIKQYGIRGPFLVIAPLSTIANWQREFEEWSDINAIVYHGSAQSRTYIQQYEMYYKDENGETINSVYKFEAIITTYEMVLSANTFLCTIPFRCLIIDEAHRLKNQKCKLMEGLNNLRMEHRVLLTGTPLQNNVEELFSLLNFLEPTRFPSQAAFLYEFGNLKTESQVDKLQQILKPMMLRRLKEDVDLNIASKEETIVEVELTTIQKKFYRAILERNFSFLAKGSGYSNLPNLMNTMMELRKCCNHPFLIKGAEDKIVSEYLTGPDDPQRNAKQLTALVESSGKMVLIDKLLPKLKAGGHKILIFSQMIRVLNLIEDYLIANRYLYERIDGGVQGNQRQASIDRFCKPDSDRFVFLLCTRAGGLGINLTSADTVIIFDSDWNPQNDLQAQARCHRIGQNKPVKVYRLICRNTYEREMFDRASLKLGLDKAILQNMNARDGASGQQAMSKKEVEDLLKKGAYGSVMETDDDAQNFCEEDIDQILKRRTQVIQIQSEGKGSTFAKASFVSDKARQDIDLDDPDFWSKWARKASIDIDDLEKDKHLIVDEPRKRKQTKRFGNDGDATVEMSDLESDDEIYEPHKIGSKSLKGNNSLSGPIERAAWTRVECFKVEKMLLIYGWGRWQEIISHAHFRQEVRHIDIEAISRTIIACCFRHYKTDDRTRQFFIDLINESASRAPHKNDKFDITNQILSSAPTKGTRGRKRGNSGRNVLRRLTHQYSKPALIECSTDWLTVEPENLIIDAGYRKHLQHHCNKIMARIRLLHCIWHDIIKEAAITITDGRPVSVVEFAVPPAEGELPAVWWDEAADKSLLMGTYKHGYEKYRLIRSDPCLMFFHKLGPLPFSEKTPASPDSINNPASIEHHDDASDPEFSVSTKKKTSKKKDVDDEDSFNESDDEKEFNSLTASPASTTSFKELPSDVKSSNNPEFRWPLPTDMNTRLRRIVAAFTKSCEKEHLDIMKAEKDKQKQERMAILAQERQRKKAEMQQKWTRREESDFYRVVSTFGVIYDRATKKYNWDKFRQLARLEKKQDDRLTVYHEEFMAMCRKVCRKSTEDDMRRYKESHVEIISEDRASRCIQRIKLLSKIREVVLPSDKLDERIKLFQISPDFPHWWEPGKHDKALLEGVAKHGLGRTEYYVLMDSDSIFKEQIEKVTNKNKVKSTEVKSTKTKDYVDFKLESPHPVMNGEHPDDAELQNKQSTTSSQVVHKPGFDFEDESRYNLPLVTEEYTQILSTWPKDKTVVSHLEKVCQCVIKGEWPKPTRFDINPMVTKLPVLTRPLISTIGQFTHAEMTSDKSPNFRGEEAAPSIINSKDFKIKSIDGLKLTVKTETKKRKRKIEVDQELSKVLSPLKDLSKLISPLKGATNVTDQRPRHTKQDDSNFKKRRKVIDGVPVVEVFHHQPQGEELFPRNVQIHIPKTINSVVSTSHASGTKPIIHFPANVKIPKVVSSSQKISLIGNLTFGKNKPLVLTPLPKTTSTPTQEPKTFKNIQQKTPTLTPSTKEINIKTKNIVEKKAPNVSSEQPVGIHINSPNANVRIQGSKIEIKEKPNTKREIDMSTVILKVPDPAKFLGNKEVKKRIRPAKTTIKTSDVASNKAAPKSNAKCEHNKEPPSVPSERIKTRPERSAKKRAKDSISEMSEAEHMSSIKDRSHHSSGSAPHSPHHQWPDLHSPSHMINSLEYYRYDYYPDRSPHSPNKHRRDSRSPLVHPHLSPSAHIHSPPLHSIHGRPLSPVRHRHNHSPTRHLHNHSPRLQDDHVKHLYTEPLSPRYHGNRENFCYSERSRSPYYLEYRHEKDDLERPPSPFKQQIMSPSPRDIQSPRLPKAEQFPFVHLTEPRSPANHRKHQHDVKSPVTSQEGRFPYGHIVELEGPRCRHGELSSLSVRSPPLDSTYQYQPLSRREIKSPIISTKKRTECTLSPELLKGEHVKQVVTSKGRVVKTSDACVTDKRIKKTVDNLASSPSNKDQPLAFYPTDKPIKTSNKELVKPKVTRPVIEIPEQTVRTPSERKTPTLKRKGIGSLLEMKIQGLKKQRMEQLTDETTVTSPEEHKKSASKPSKSISAVLDTLSNAGKVTSSESSSLIDSLSRTSRGSKTLTAEPTTSLGIPSSKPDKKETIHNVKSLHLDAIAKNLTKAVEKSINTVSTSPDNFVTSKSEKLASDKSPPFLVKTSKSVKVTTTTSKDISVTKTSKKKSPEIKFHPSSVVKDTIKTSTLQKRNRESVLQQNTTPTKLPELPFISNEEHQRMSETRKETNSIKNTVSVTTQGELDKTNINLKNHKKSPAEITSKCAAKNDTCKTSNALTNQTSVVLTSKTVSNKQEQSIIQKNVDTATPKTVLQVNQEKTPEENFASSVISQKLLQIPPPPLTKTPDLNFKINTTLLKPKESC